MQKSIFSLKSQSKRAGLSVWVFANNRLKHNIQCFIDSLLFELSIAFLIVVSVSLVFLEFFLPPGADLNAVVWWNNVLTIVFTVELFFRWYVAPSRKIFFKNYWVDIISILPIISVLREFRLLKLLRLLRLGRVLLILLRRTHLLSKQNENSIGLLFITLLTAVILVVCWTLVILTIESPPTEVSVPLNHFLNRVWSTSFLFISGEMMDDLPNSPWARFVEVLVAVSGLLLFAFFVGAVSSIMTTYWKIKMEEKDLDLSDLSGHTIICGWDRLAATTLSELELSTDLWQRGVVVVTERKTDIFSELKLKNTRRLFHLADDFTKMDVLEKAGARTARSAIILSELGDNLSDQVRDARTVLAALTLEKLNPEIFTCAELIDEVNATHLRIAGVEEIVSRNNISAGLFASAIVNRGITTVISDLLSQKHGAYFRKLEVPDEFVGAPFVKAFDYFKHEHNATVIAIDYAEGDNNYTEHHLNPSNDYILKDTDTLIIITSVKSKFKKLVT